MPDYNSEGTGVCWWFGHDLLFIIIVQLIPQSRNWETTSCSYSGRIVLYLQLSRLTNIVITLLALPLLELPN